MSQTRLSWILAMVMLVAANAWAQGKADRLPGIVGLQAGSQPPPGIYVGYLAWIYPTDTVKDEDGEQVGSGSRKLTSTLQGPLVSWVMPVKLLGGNVGGTVAFPFIRNRIDANVIEDIDTGLGYTDTILTPISLGWHRPRADFLAAYNLYLPTGKFEPGSPDNTGLGMFGQELQFATTSFFDAHRLWSGAISFEYEWNSKKEDLDLRVGQVLTIEGGVGRTFYKKVNNPLPLITNIGLVGYTQLKVTEDSGSDRSPLLPDAKDRVYALGGEFNIFIPQARLTFIARVLPEFGARLRTQGTTISLSVAYVAKSFHPPAP